MSASSNDSAHPKTLTWLLERLAQGELDAAETERLRARLAAEGRSLADELAALAASDRAILAEQPKETMAAAIRVRAARSGPRSVERRSSFNLWIAPLALAGSLGVALVAVRAGKHPTGASVVSSSTAANAEESTRIKGDPRSTAPRLLVYRQRAAAARDDASFERLSDGARAARGDLVQLAYAAPHDGLYGVLLSIDGAGHVTQHLPQKGDGDGDGDAARAAPPLRSAREIRLPSSYELDDAPGFERFLLVTAAEPFSISVALDAARALAAQRAQARSLPLALAPAFHQTSVLLQKTNKGTP
jgi:hypothetical protein